MWQYDVMVTDYVDVSAPPRKRKGISAALTALAPFFGQYIAAYQQTLLDPHDRRVLVNFREAEEKFYEEMGKVGESKIFSKLK